MATGIDLFILGSLTLLVSSFFLPIVAAVNRAQLPSVVTILIDTALFIISFILPYCFVQPALMSRSGNQNGITWGRSFMRVKVIREDGQPMSFKDAFMRDVVFKWLVPLAVFTALEVPTILLTQNDSSNFVLLGQLTALILIVLVFIWGCFPMLNRKGDALHDRKMNTRVIIAKNESKPLNWRETLNSFKKDR